MVVTKDLSRLGRDYIKTGYYIENYFPETFYSIIGFVLGSVLILYPGFTFNITGFISILCFVGSFLISLQFEKLE